MQKVKNFLVAKVRLVLASPLAVKALHTFWQAFLAALLVTNFKLDKTALVAAVAAALSAVKSSLAGALRN